MNNAQRIVFIETLFQIVEEIGLDSIDELLVNIYHYVPMIIKAMKNLEKERRQYLLYPLRIVVLGGKLNLQKLPVLTELDDVRITSGDDDDLASFSQEYELFIASVNS